VDYIVVLFIASAAWALAITTLLVKSVRQYGYYQVLRPDDRPPGDDLPALSVIVPARNEAEGLAQCINRLLAQDYPADRFGITVVDDHSVDETARVAREIAQRDPRVRVIAANPLPPGWTGKAHACWQGAAAAGPSPWLCFIDADTSSQPPLLRTAMREALRRGSGLLSLGPEPQLCSPWERLIVPAGFFLIALTQDVRGMNDPENLNGHANGQFLLIQREVYDEIGGFAAVNSTVAEDSALARAVKRAGHLVAVLGTEGLIGVRMYRDLRSLWEGLGRQGAELLGGIGMIVAWAIGALLLGWVAVLLPVAVAIAVARHGAHPVALAALVLSLAASLALSGTHIGAARFFRIPVIYGILFPLSYTLGAAILLTAARHRQQGVVSWKGRVYKPALKAT
jgi:chlorobactene glucosyltransferase